MRLFSVYSSRKNCSPALKSPRAPASVKSRMSSPAADMKDFINGEIGAHKVVVFSKTYCPYCQYTKKLFMKQEFSGINVVYHELDKRRDGPAIQATLQSMS